MPLPSDTGTNSNDLEGSDLLNRAIEAYYNDIARAVGSRFNSQVSTLDIVHDLYVKLAAQPEALHGKRSIKAFLCRAAVNLSTDRYRREQFERNLFSPIDAEDQTICMTSVSPDYRLETEARIRILRDAIAELPVRRRAVFILHRLHNLTPDEIASKLNISRNMVNRHLRRALAHCLDCLIEMD